MIKWQKSSTSSYYILLTIECSLGYFFDKDSQNHFDNAYLNASDLEQD